ncbi:DBT family protein [Megaselia abdita]
MSALLRNSSLVFKNCIPQLKQIQLSRSIHMTPCLDKLVSFKLSDIGEGIREVVVKEWYVKPGDKVEQFDNLCEVQSDKASVTITSRYDGKITKLHYKVDDIALVGKPLLDFDVEEEGEDDSSSSDSDEEKAPEVKTKVEEVQATEKSQVLCTPSVRKMAKENNINLSEVPGTGKQGRVLKGDVLEFLGQVPAGTNIPHPTLLKATPSKPVQVAADRTEQLKGVRKAMLKTMTESLKIPHFAYKDDVDMSNLMKFRDQLKTAAAERGVGKLTFMPFCIKAASIGLTKYPLLNSSLDVEKETIIYKGAHNISVAIDTPQGLVVPNIKNCQNKSILEIAKDLNDLVERGRVGKLAPADFADGTFTLSNIGVIGGTYTFPVIMAPQVSIGGMGRTKAVPKFGPNDEIIKAHIMNISWVCDHRIIDGVTIANFSNVWKQYLENPALFLIDQ